MSQLIKPEQLSLKFKELKGYEDYYLISECGKIYSKRTNKLINPFITKSGYLRIELNVNNVSKKYAIHRLVAYTFIGNEEGKQINHKNGNKKDNHYTNLEWVTCRENINHAIGIGLINVKGENNPFAKYTNVERNEIKSLYENGYKIIQISRLKNIPRTTIQNIIKR
ncbi:MAG: hypothetical protein RLZ54_1009 [Candidatus Parcubacteria bacterium]|jgi:hypothetical protein